MLAVDAMGGDNAPKCVVEGCGQYLSRHPESRIRLFGQKALVEPLISGMERVELIDCAQVITMHDEPMMAVRRMPDSSLMMGLKDVKAGVSRAFVSAGSTGALFLGGMVTLRMLRGISRPALAPVLPGEKGPFLLIDSGANADCQSEYLNQFGLMGSVYMNRVFGVKEPRVGLVNIGAEPEKGSKLYKEAYQLMTAQTAYRFCGNCEAREIQKGEFDVVVADGFTGNVILKYAEGFASMLMHTMKREITSTARGKLGGLLVKPAMKNIKKRMTTDEYGGAPLMGVNGVVVKAHGSSGGYAFMKALEQAQTMAENDLVGSISCGLAEYEKRNDTEETTV